jgi:methylase of polypeptide subunit release factors
MQELRLLSPIEASRFRDFFRDSEYTADHVRKAAGITEFPSRRLRNQAQLMDRTSQPGCLNTLLRWFWVGVAVEQPYAEQFLPAWFIAGCLECGLLRQSPQGLVAGAMLVPWEEFLIASDHTLRFDAADPDLVLWPNPTSRLLSRFTIRRPSRLTLDLGTGSGVLALALAAHSQRVVATDLNRRALRFTEFNARLNGIENISCVAGDRFAPVQDCRFDLIVSNPPFFISPSDDFLFCDNPFELDQLCHRLAQEAPAQLNEGGYFQMLCEWAQVRDERWEDRLAGWLQNTGCDAWVIKGFTQDPSAYALEKIRGMDASPDHDEEKYAKYMDYYREKSVEAIHGGLVVMRRRSGQNWIRIEEMPHTPKVPFGESVEWIFTSRDFLQSHEGDEEMLKVKPRLSPHAQLENTYEQAERNWQLSSVTLRLVKGFPFSVGLQPLVADFICRFDGTLTVEELVKGFAQALKKTPESVQPECLRVVRKLVESGFLLV